MDYERVLKRNRKKAIADPAVLSGQQSFSELDYGVDAIKKIIPHRDPFLLISPISLSIQVRYKWKCQGS